MYGLCSALSSNLLGYSSSETSRDVSGARPGKAAEGMSRDRGVSVSTHTPAFLCPSIFAPPRDVLSVSERVVVGHSSPTILYIHPRPLTSLVAMIYAEQQHPVALVDPVYQYPVYAPAATDPNIPPPPPVSMGWAAHWDRGQQKYYYHNLVSGAVTWEPREFILLYFLGCGSDKLSNSSTDPNIDTADNSQ